MATKNNKSTGGGSTGAGMQVSGEEIFREPETEMHRVSEEEVQAAFGDSATTAPLGDIQSVTGAQSAGQSGATDQTSTAQPSETAQAAAAQVGEVLRGNTAPVTDAAKQAFSQAKGVAGTVAGQALGQVQEKAGSAIEAQKQNLTEGLNSVADSVRSLGNNLRSSDQAPAIANVAARYSDTVADQVEQLARYFETRDLRDLSRDVQGFARRNPTVFVAGAFTLGLLAARFIKSSPRQELVTRDYYNSDFSVDQSSGAAPTANQSSGQSSTDSFGSSFDSLTSSSTNRSDVGSTSSGSSDLNTPINAKTGGGTPAGTTGSFGGTTTTDPLEID